MKLFSRFLFISLFASSIFAQTSIAVLELEGKGLTDMEASILSDRLRHELFQTGKYKVIERELMGDIIDEQGFQLSECTSTECMVEIGQLLGVDQMIGGSVSQFGSMFSIAVRLVSVQTGEFLGTATYDHEGRMEDLLKYGMKAVSDKLSGLDEEDAVEESVHKPTEEATTIASQTAQNQTTTTQPEEKTVATVPSQKTPPVSKSESRITKNMRIMLRSEIGVQTLTSEYFTDYYDGTVGPVFSGYCVYNVMHIDNFGDLGFLAGFQTMMFLLSENDRVGYGDDYTDTYAVLRFGLQASTGTMSTLGITGSMGYARVSLQRVNDYMVDPYTDTAGGVFFDIIVSLRPLQSKNLSLDAGFGILSAGEENIYGGSKIVVGGSIGF